VGGFKTITTVGSTVPKNGDLNPYGVAVVTHSKDRLHKGDVLAEVEAGVLIRAAEAGGVEKEHHHVRPPAASSLQEPHPFRVRAWSDHSGGAARQPAESIPRERFRQRHSPIGLRHSEVVQDQPVLSDGPVRLEDRAFCIVRDEPNLPAAAMNLRCHRCGQADAVLQRRLLALAEVDVLVEVEQDPEVSCQRLLERLGHQPAVARRERPMDAAEAVAGRVIADSTGLGWVVSPGAQGR